MRLDYSGFCMNARKKITGPSRLLESRGRGDETRIAPSQSAFRHRTNCHGDFFLGRLLINAGIDCGKLFAMVEPGAK